MTTHISGHNVHDVTRRVLDLARAGDFRALKVPLWGQPGVLHDRIRIVTPHRKSCGELDVADLAAQIHALAFDQFSDDGTYTDGYYSCRGEDHLTGAPSQWD